jgi:heme/copper-type cytochrome/quinol oxidase subunit 2
MSNNLGSIMQDLIPQAILNQKNHMHMNPFATVAHLIYVMIMMLVMTVIIIIIVIITIIIISFGSSEVTNKL